ncbi:RAM signaling pathway protein [Thozetella sp. PMI_491]|nr:RAM signaling pathway protein [Thozetella sp. PMI_491]
MDRPRGLPENPAQGRRTNQSLPPVPPLRDVASSSNLAPNPPMSSGQVIALAREAMRAALDEHETQAAEASGVSNELKPGVTIDLSRKNIARLPDEVVDIIKNELERLALSHNSLTTFPARFSECSSLRYLNVRQNKIREFPLALCDLRSLEILDLGRNKLRILPPDIIKLSSLKVLSIQKNQISELPLCLADMSSLQMLKLDGNPLVFPPPEVLQVQATSPPNEGILKESEVTEVAITAHIKKFLRQRAATSLNTRNDTDTGEDSSEGTETPRVPVKRVVSGRFPIKVNGTDLPDLRSPNLSRPPPIPTRSHYRGLSQQNTAQRRPGVMPLTIGNVNERIRSNSETVLQTPRGERPESRNRRMGIVSRKPSELGTLDETQANNRFSHYRGLSHGSAMQGNGTGMAKSPGPGSPAAGGDPYLQRPIYVRRLSILPERKRESKLTDPILEAAKGILYSIFQIHPMIQMLMSLTSDGSVKRSSLEIVFYNTNDHVEELELEIQKHEPLGDEEVYGQRENESVQRACLTLVNAYSHVCTLLAGNVDLFIDNGDPRYIRTLLTQLYNSIMELRVTCAQLVPPEDGYRRAATRAAYGGTIKPRSRESSVAPSDRSSLTVRPRNNPYNYQPSNLRVATDVPIPPMPFINGTGRTATITSATPRSGESFTSTSTSGGRGLSADFTEEDRLFEKIFLSLQKSAEVVMRNLPTLNRQFNDALRNAMNQRAPEHALMAWRALIAKCSSAIHQTEMLKARLSTIKLKEPGIRTHRPFWGLCYNFVDAWYGLVKRIWDAENEVPLPLDTRNRLRPIHKTLKECSTLMQTSPWSYLYKEMSMGEIMSPYSTQSATPIALPMTPQSAALGPAVQATVPSTPQSGSFAAAFNGGVFERAETLISMGGLSMSRTGTMTSNSTSSLNSFSSTLSSQDGIMTPSSMISPGPGPLGPLPLRLNNGSKVAF